jgi:hypothetical protein
MESVGFRSFDDLVDAGGGVAVGHKHFTTKLRRWIERSQIGDSVIDFNVAEIRWGDLEPIVGTLS